jgi:hypothetical protein
MNIIKKEVIWKVGDIKLFDMVGGEMVVGFSEDGSEVYYREVGDEGGVMTYDEALKMLDN